MLKLRMVHSGLRPARREAGDTLIEVTFALAILSFVLLSSTALAALAFRMGQTARERTQVSVEAQQQMEALRSFRDNHTWIEFQGGSSCGGPGGYCGIDQMVGVAGTPCQYDPALRCFHMAPPGGGVTEWRPAVGSTTGSVPTSILEISTNTPAVQRGCGYDFSLHYSFDPLGGGPKQANRITTRLVNLTYGPSLGACPS